MAIEKQQGEAEIHLFSSVHVIGSISGELKDTASRERNAMLRFASLCSGRARMAKTHEGRSCSEANAVT